MSDIFLSICDPLRAALFREVGLDPERVPVSSPAPGWANLPGVGRALVYEMAIGDLTEDQRQRLAALLAGRFGLPVEEVVRDLDVVGCPILADGCMLVEYAV